MKATCTQRIQVSKQESDGSVQREEYTHAKEQPSKHDHMGPMWAIGGRIVIWVL